jgi:hypothetical protein
MAWSGGSLKFWAVIRLRFKVLADGSRWNPLIEHGKQVLRLLGGIGAIAFGIVFAVVRNVQYVENDIRSSDGYNFAAGAFEIAIGVWLLLSLRYPRLRGPGRKRDD